jgi:hypothetical protein
MTKTESCLLLGIVKLPEWVFDIEGIVDECMNCRNEVPNQQLINNQDGNCDECNRWYDCIHTEQNPCYYFEETRHYMCQDCRNGKNHTPDIETRIEYCKLRLNQIEGEKKELIDFLIEYNNGVD